MLEIEIDVSICECVCVCVRAVDLCGFQPLPPSPPEGPRSDRSPFGGVMQLPSRFVSSAMAERARSVHTNHTCVCVGP